MCLLEKYLTDFMDYLVENDIDLQVIGQTYRLSPQVRRVLQQTQAQTKNKPANATLCLALSYGGRDDIVETSRKIAEDGRPFISMHEYIQSHLSKLNYRAYTLLV